MDMEDKIGLKIFMWEELTEETLKAGVLIIPLHSLQKLNSIFRFLGMDYRSEVSVSSLQKILVALICLLMRAL